MSFPEQFKYTKDHEWLSLPSTGPTLVGVTSYAVEQLGDIVHIELPEVGESFESGASFGTIESTKTVSDLYMPVAGKIVAVNTNLVKSPEKLQDDPYTAGWLVKVDAIAGSKTSELLSAAQYGEYIKNN